MILDHHHVAVAVLEVARAVDAAAPEVEVTVDDREVDQDRDAVDVVEVIVETRKEEKKQDRDHDRPNGQDTHAHGGNIFL